MIKPNKDNCCGCGVCVHVCAHSAITMKADDFGFLVPEVDYATCINCGLCERVCPFGERGDVVYQRPKAYAIRHKDDEVVRASRSGGFFTALTDIILQNGGVVYGAALSNQLTVNHIRAVSSAERNRMRGSKYAQSSLDDICVAVKQDLKAGKSVVFSGTPCQVAAIERYVGNRLKEKLILVDIICHGVGSPKVWKKFTDYIEQTQGRRILHADFRDKEKYGWDGLHKESFMFEHDTKRCYFPFVYYSDLHVRDCCRNCPYTQVPRQADITLGDLWGFEKVVPEWGKGNNGISLVLINSEKGARLMRDCSNSIESKQIDLSRVMQPHLSRPIVFDDNRRKEYSDDFLTHSFEFVIKKYHKVERPSFIALVLNKIKLLIAK